MRSGKWIVAAVWLVSLCFLSCNDDDNILPITLAYEDVVYDDSNSALFLSNSLEKISIQIKGGDGNYTSTNDNETILSIECNQNTISLKPLIIGQAKITITDGLGNSYSLIVTVIDPNITAFPSHTDCLIHGDNLSEQDKADLVEDIRTHSLYGGFRFISDINGTKTGKLRLYPTNYDGTEYEEFDYVLDGELSDNLKPNLIDTQIYSWYPLTSGNEELCLYITRYWKPENAIQLRSDMISLTTIVMDVTTRYKAKYTELTKAYVIYRYN